MKNINDQSDRARLDRHVREYIDKGVPVIARIKGAFAVICGYDERDLYCIEGENVEPERCHYDELIFSTYKRAKPPIAEVYRNAVMNIPSFITMPETDEFSFGKKALTDWAESFQNGSFDAYAADDKIWLTHLSPAFSCWNQHGTYLCILGTNNCAGGFLEKALELNPDMTFINKLLPLFNKLNGEGFHTLLNMEGGFGIKPETVKDKKKMAPVSNKIFELAKIYDEVLDVFDHIVNVSSTKKE